MQSPGRTPPTGRLFPWVAGARSRHLSPAWKNDVLATHRRHSTCGSLTVSFLLPVWLPRPWVAALAFTLIGLAVSTTKVVVVSLAQRLTSDELLGRVNATYRLLGLGTMPLGALLGGALGTVLGLPPVFHTAAALCALAAAVTAKQLTAVSLAAAPPR
jgi:MFS family permease